MNTKLKVIRSLEDKASRQAELGKELERNVFLQSIHPDIFDRGAVTATVVAVQVRGTREGDDAWVKEVVECYFLNTHGNKFPVNREQCAKLYPDRIMSKQYRYNHKGEVITGDSAPSNRRDTPTNTSTGE